MIELQVLNNVWFILDKTCLFWVELLNLVQDVLRFLSSLNFSTYDTKRFESLDE